MSSKMIRTLRHGRERGWQARLAKSFQSRKIRFVSVDKVPTTSDAAGALIIYPQPGHLAFPHRVADSSASSDAGPSRPAKSGRTASRRSSH